VYSIYFTVYVTYITYRCVFYISAVYVTCVTYRCKKQNGNFETGSRQGQ